MLEKIVTENKLMEIGLELAPKLGTLAHEDDVIGCVKELFQNRFEIEVIETNDDDLYKIYYDETRFIPENTVKELMRDYLTKGDELEKNIKEWIATDWDEDEIELIYTQDPSTIEPDRDGFYDVAVATDDYGTEFQVSVNPHTLAIRIDEFVKETTIQEIDNMLGQYEDACAVAHCHPDYKEA